MAKNQQDVMDWVVGYVSHPTPNQFGIEHLMDWHFEVFKSMVSAEAQALGMSREEIVRGLLDHGQETGYFTSSI